MFCLFEAASFYRMLMRINILFTLIFLLPFYSALAQQPNPPGQVSRPGELKNEAYLFAHMMHADYGRLYYSVSLDGLHWTQLNEGKQVFGDYRGHPDICRGHDGRYYMVGNNNDDDPQIRFWVSDNLVDWKGYGTYTPDLKSTPGYPEAMQRIGAPKLFFDENSQQYMLSWHTPHKEGTKDNAEIYWASQRTLYVLASNLKSFPATPQKLFDWNIGTIDVIIRKEGGNYYAILKDEAYPTLYWVTGKTIRIARSNNLTGPYSLPSQPVSPNFREAPALIPSPDGKAWYLYYEQYPGVSYGLSISDNLNGPWYQASGYTFYSTWDKYSLPPAVRHGCMITISRKEYDTLIAKFGLKQ